MDTAMPVETFRTYMLIVFALSCLGMVILIGIEGWQKGRSAFEGFFGLVMVGGAFFAGVTIGFTYIASSIQDYCSEQPVDFEAGWTTVEFLIYTGIVYSLFCVTLFAILGMTILQDGRTTSGDLKTTFTATIICTIMSIAITSGASSIQYYFDQPEPPAIERINFDEGQSYK